jgi:hypothetical protein
MKTDTELWAAHIAGDETAFDELERRWRPHLVEYTLKRVADAEPIVNEVFDRLREHTGELEVRVALFATAHHLSGAAGSWRDGMVLLLRDAPI